MATPIANGVRLSYVLVGRLWATATYSSTAPASAEWKCTTYFSVRALCCCCCCCQELQLLYIAPAAAEWKCTTYFSVLCASSLLLLVSRTAASIHSSSSSGVEVYYVLLCTSTLLLLLSRHLHSAASLASLSAEMKSKRHFPSSHRSPATLRQSSK